MTVKVDNRTFEETLHDERKRLQTTQISKRNTISEEDLDKRVIEWLHEQQGDVVAADDIEHPAIRLNLSEEEFDEKLNEFLAAKDWKQAVELLGYDVTPGALSFIRRLAVSRGLFD